LKESTSNPEAPVKKWDSKPELKTIGRSMTWDGSKGSDVFQELLKGSEIRSWSGDRSTLEKNQEARKRSAEEDLDEELDRGRSKKVKKKKEEPGAYKWDQNPFQVAQNITNRGDKLNGQSKSHDERRSGDWHSGSRDNSSKRGYDHHDQRGYDHHKKDRHSDHYHKFHKDYRHKDRHHHSHQRYERHGSGFKHREDRR
jgi:hypothetical protein